MALVTSDPVRLGHPLPSFTLPDFDGRVFESQDITGPAGTLVTFLCNHCPYVQHVADGLSALARELTGQGVGVVGINSNDPDRYPEDDADHMRVEADKRGYAFPYLIDLNQNVARAFGAVCTPDFFLFDSGGKLYYRGQLDGSRPGNSHPVDGADLRNAVSLLLAGSPAPSQQRASLGCSIKWRRDDDAGQ